MTSDDPLEAAEVIQLADLPLRMAHRTEDRLGSQPDVAADA